MKPYTVAALFAAATVCAVAPANAATAEQYLAAFDELVGAVNEMADVLSTVNDKASADAAAPKVTALVAKIKAVRDTTAEYGEASPEIQEQMKAARPDLEQELMGAIFGLLGAMEGAVNDEENPCYGSAALLEALEAINE